MQYKTPIIEKPHRLPKEFYKGEITVFYTLCIKDRKKLFENSITVGVFVNILREALEKFKCRDFAYVFMPDHVHLVIEGAEESSDLWSMIKWYKQKTGYWLSKNAENIKWQKDYYDHIHQKKSDFTANMVYVLNNPVRKKLCDDWQKYEFIGSISYDIKDLINW
ncbi:MAG: transposase [Candidatus Firestonebacteria bacterium]